MINKQVPIDSDRDLNKWIQTGQRLPLNISDIAPVVGDRNSVADLQYSSSAAILPIEKKSPIRFKIQIKTKSNQMNSFLKLN